MRGEEEREKVRWEKKKREGGGEEERSIYTPPRSRRGKRPYPRGLVRSRFDDFSFSSFSLSLFFFAVCAFPLAVLRGDEMKSIMPANRSFYFSALRKWGCISVHVDGDGIHGMV